MEEQVIIVSGIGMQVISSLSSALSRKLPSARLKMLSANYVPDPTSPAETSDVKLISRAIGLSLLCFPAIGSSYTRDLHQPLLHLQQLATYPPLHVPQRLRHWPPMSYPLLQIVQLSRKEVSDLGRINQCTHDPGQLKVVARISSGERFDRERRKGVKGGPGVE